MTLFSEQQIVTDLSLIPSLSLIHKLCIEHIPHGHEYACHRQNLVYILLLIPLTLINSL